MKIGDIGNAVVVSATFAGVGLAVFALAFYLMVKFTPFSIRKEIEEDQNVALAIIMAGIIIGISFIISSAIGG